MGQIRDMTTVVGMSYLMYDEDETLFADIVDTDAKVIRREAEETVRACIRYGCPYDYVLKDISAVSHHPENLIVWARTVSDVLDRYYGAE